MGEITVYFGGICTHMRWTPSDGSGAPSPLPLDIRHRVVLVNGREWHLILEKPIAPHYAMLSVATADVLSGAFPGGVDVDGYTTWDLAGDRLEVADPIGELVHDSSFDCIPHLSDYTPELPPPSIPVVLEALPDKAACYFEVRAGVFTAGTIGEGAATAALKVQTSGPNPILRGHRFGDHSIYEMTLRSGAAIAVMNVGKDGCDDGNDFLLHYKTAEHIPSGTTVPQKPPACCQPLQTPAGLLPVNVGSGCSNSAFP